MKRGRSHVLKRETVEVLIKDREIKQDGFASL
jgi:hypothetical protein